MTWRARRGHANAAWRACSTRWGDGTVAHHGIAPLVDAQQLGQELGAVAIGLARHRIERDPGAHRLHGAPSGAGSTDGRRRAAQGRPRACASTSSAKTCNALRTRRATPSGWRQAPRPSTLATGIRAAPGRGVTSPPPAGRVVGHSGQAEDTGAALPGTLARHVAGDARRLGQPAGPHGEDEQHARSHHAADLGHRPRRVGAARAGGHPRAPEAAGEHRADSVDGPGRPDDVAQRGAHRDLEHPGTRHRPPHRHQGRPGRASACPA